MMAFERPRVRAAIFDRDGVLTRFDLPTLRAFFEPLLPLSLGDLAERWQRWCERGGCPRTLDEEATFWGVFWDDLARELGLADETRAALRAFDYTISLRAFPDARGALLTARSRGLRVGVLSNFPLASLDRSLHAAGLSDAVDVAYSSTLAGASKPAPEAYLAVTRSLGVDPAECVFFDDEIACVEGARAVGAQAFLVDRRLAAHATPEGVVCDLGALPSILEERGKA